VNFMHRDAVPLVSHKESGSAGRRGCQDRRSRTSDRQRIRPATPQQHNGASVAVSLQSPWLKGKADGFLLPVCSNADPKHLKAVA